VITRKGRSGCDRMVVLWIYNYMCNKCLSPLMLCVHGEVYSIQQYVKKPVSDLRQSGLNINVCPIPVKTDVG
jgi:hypothetical protein